MLRAAVVDFDAPLTVEAKSRSTWKSTSSVASTLAVPCGSLTSNVSAIPSRRKSTPTTLLASSLPSTSPLAGNEQLQSATGVGCLSSAATSVWMWLQTAVFEVFCHSFSIVVPTAVGTGSPSTFSPFCTLFCSGFPL